MKKLTLTLLALCLVCLTAVIGCKKQEAPAVDEPKMEQPSAEEGDQPAEVDEEPAPAEEEE